MSIIRPLVFVLSFFVLIIGCTNNKMMEHDLSASPNQDKFIMERSMIGVVFNDKSVYPVYTVLTKSFYTNDSRLRQFSSIESPYLKSIDTKYTYFANGNKEVSSVTKSRDQNEIRSSENYYLGLYQIKDGSSMDINKDENGRITKITDKSSSDLKVTSFTYHTDSTVVTAFRIGSDTTVTDVLNTANEVMHWYRSVGDKIIETTEYNLVQNKNIQGDFHEIYRDDTSHVIKLMDYHGNVLRKERFVRGKLIEDIKPSYLSYKNGIHWYIYPFLSENSALITKRRYNDGSEEFIVRLENQKLKSNVKEYLDDYRSINQLFSETETSLKNSINEKENNDTKEEINEKENNDTKEEINESEIRSEIESGRGYFWANESEQTITILVFTSENFLIEGHIKVNGGAVKNLSLKGKWQLVDSKTAIGRYNNNPDVVTRWIFNDDYTHLTNNKGGVFERKWTSKE